MADIIIASILGLIALTALYMYVRWPRQVDILRYLCEQKRTGARALEISKGIKSTGYGALIPVLVQMTEEGLVHMDEYRVAGTGHKVRFYMATAKGRERYAALTARKQK